MEVTYPTYTAENPIESAATGPKIGIELVTSEVTTVKASIIAEGAKVFIDMALPGTWRPRSNLSHLGDGTECIR